MANKGVELINKVNRHDTQIDEIAETLDMQRSKRKKMGIDIAHLRSDFEFNRNDDDRYLKQLFKSSNLHANIINELLEEVTSLHKWLMWQSLSVLVLVIAFFVQAIWG